MSIKRILISILVFCALVLAAGGASTALGSTQAVPPEQVSSPSSLTIPYSGHLTDQSGKAPVADGAYDLIFTLYDAETTGNAVWTETLNGITVQDGDFTTFLGSANPLTKATLDGQKLWLEVSVRGPDESAFTALSPRQPVVSTATASPSSTTTTATCPHDHWGESWSGTGGKTGLYISSAGGYALEGWSSGNIGLLGVSVAPGGMIVIPSGMIGLYGIGDGYGIQAYGQHGAYFAGYDEHQDLLLGGDVGRINAADNPNSQLYLSSNADVIVKLDNDSGGNNVFRVKNSGGGDACTIDEAGNFVCSGNKSGFVSDISQNDDSVTFEQGDVVAISGTGPAVVGEIPVIKVRLATAADATAVIGVVDQRYYPNDPDKMFEESDVAPGQYLSIVTLGSYKAIKVDASYGAIKPGDLLVASPHAGFAMRAGSPSPGTVIGKALGELQAGTGVIAVMVTMQ